MTGLMEDDLSRLFAGLMLTRKANADSERKIADIEQEERIIAALRDESDTQMLLDVALGDLAMLRLNTEVATNLRADGQ